MISALVLALGTQLAQDATLPDSTPTEAGKLEQLTERIAILERLREIDQESQETKSKTTPVVEAGASSFQLRSADKAWSIRLRGLVRSAAIWDLNDETHKTLDRIQSHTVRLGAEGALGKKLGYRIVTDFSKGGASLWDGYSDIKFAPWAQLRIGKFGVPLGWERPLSPSDNPFQDRPFTSAVAPNRDVGIQVSGEVLGEKLQYALAAVNGGPDGSNLNDDNNDDKDAYARLWAAPGKGSSNAWLEGLGFGVGGSYGYHEVSLTNYRTAGGQTFFTWNAADSAKGIGWRVAPQASWTAGPYWLYGEFIRSVQDVTKGPTASARGAAPKEIGVNAWLVGASWVVTGEDASEKSVKPRHAFDGSENGGLGALELSARVSGLKVDDEVFPVYADTLRSAESALSWAVAANWHLVKGTRLQLAYERTTFEGGAEKSVVVGTKTVKQVRDRKPEGLLSVVASTAF